MRENIKAAAPSITEDSLKKIKLQPNEAMHVLRALADKIDKALLLTVRRDSSTS